MKVRRSMRPVAAPTPEQGRTIFPPPSGMTRDQVRADLIEGYGYIGPFAELFAGNEGTVVHKWHHYLPLYDRYFAPWRGKPVRFLEIGVSLGGSLAMWRKYFGPDAVIFGIDIDPTCARFNGRDGEVRIGSQADPEFLKQVIDEMGGVDVILDDGSHQVPHIRASLQVLFPRLAMGGIYMIEDLHTVYWRRWGGTPARDQNWFQDVLTIIHDMHHWYHDLPPGAPGIGSEVRGLSVHDSMVVLEKGPARAPVHTKIGTPLA